MSPFGPLADEVAQFRAGSYSLADDLANFERVWRVGAAEAAVFYCARAVDGLSIAAVERLRLEPSLNSFSNLRVLEECGLLVGAMRYWVHGLRRLGNDVRHLLRSVNAADAEVGLLYLERWLDWFFCRFPVGEPLSSITTNGQPIASVGQPAWREIVQAIHAANDAQAIVAIAEHPDVSLLAAATPTISAVLVESLLDGGEAERARAMAARALAQFPDELRLRQLHALAQSRLGELDDARESLEKLRERFADDDETSGILAGVYKRLADRQPGESQWLARSHRLYRDAWKRSRKSNLYVAINAATTALWLGDLATCRETAAEVRAVSRERRAAVGRVINHQLESDYWDEVTLAEAELLLGEWRAANEIYARALAAHSQLQGNIAVTRRQAEHILDRLGAGDPRARLPALYDTAKDSP